MRFAVALPWWGYALAFAAAVFFGWLAYARIAVSLARGQRAILVTLRAVTLVLLVAFLLRPVIFVPAEGMSDGLVPILVDVSRSMRIADAGGQGTSRLARAAAAVKELQQQLAPGFRTELVTFGEAVTKADINQLAADARRSDLSGALATLVDRYRGRRLAGIVVLSDGGDTAGQEAGTARRLGAPVFALGVGNPAFPRDREVINVTAGEPLLSDSSIDLSVSAASHGFATAPIEIRVTENGRPIDVRRVTPSERRRAGSRSVHRLAIAASIDGLHAWRFRLTAAKPSARTTSGASSCRRRDAAAGCSSSRARRDSSTLFSSARCSATPASKSTRSSARDKTKKGATRSSSRRDRAARRRSPTDIRRSGPSSSSTTPSSSAISPETSSPAISWTMTADFVAERGGGLLVLGARSFDRSGLVGTPLEEVLPIDFAIGRSSIARGSVASAPAANAISLTADGALHPATRLAVTVEESRKKWAQLPPMASATALGVASAGRPGAGRNVGERGRPPARDRDAALRRRPLDGVCRRGVVALAHAAAVDRQHLRVRVAADDPLARVRRLERDRDPAAVGVAPGHDRDGERARPQRGVQARWRRRGGAAHQGARWHRAQRDGGAVGSAGWTILGRPCDSIRRASTAWPPTSGGARSRSARSAVRCSWAASISRCPSHG